MDLIYYLLISFFVHYSFTDTNICTDGYFQCANDTICIPQKSNCDGNLDCPSGSDELNCDDIHGDDYYDHLFKKRLSAENDDLEEKCSLTYNGICLCRYKDLLCNDRNLTKIIDDFPMENIDLLDFNGNFFRVLSRRLLENIPTKVNKLSLVHCSTIEIEKNAFFDLNNINHLHLDNNDLKIFPAELFSKDNNLKTLSLMYNDISIINQNAFMELINLNELDLRGNKLTHIKRITLEPLKNLTILYLQNNRIRHVNEKTFPNLPLLLELSLMENKMESLVSGTFTNMPKLRNLFLSNNRLSLLKNGTFNNLVNLRVLTLNDNFIKNIELGVFIDVPNLNSLKLERNQFRMLDKKVLQPLKKLPYIYFDRFEMCSAATHVRVCYPKGDGISSQEHLLANPILRASVWIMGGIGCIGNLIVLFGRLFAPTNNIVHSLYLKNLAISDLLMGIYLFSIASVDQYYRGVYLRYQYLWRHSYFCDLCGFLSTLSCESSVLILSLVTWDRFISVTQPLARRQPSPKIAIVTLIALWVFAILVATIPVTKFTSNYFGSEFYGSNGVCLSLHIHDPYAMGWEYSAVMFIFLNAIALIFISYAYLRMINAIKSSGLSLRSTRQVIERDKIAQRFGIIILTDCLCWVPIIVVKLVALFGYPVHQNLYAWLAIFILPINSALNPILYTLTTTIFKKQVEKTFNSCIRKRNKAQENNQSGFESGFSLSFGVFPLRRSSSKRIVTQSSLITSKSSCKNKPAVV